LDLKLDSWSKPLEIDSMMLDPTAADVRLLMQIIASRSRAIKDELKAFVRGEKGLIT
jgi:hypothetical protein